MEADQLGRLRDILTAANLIASYVKDRTEADFHKNTEKQDAVIRRIEIIGEAAVHLTEETRQAIPFRKMRGMRNMVAHDYANVDLKILWDVATVHVPEVASVLEKFSLTWVERPDPLKLERVILRMWSTWIGNLRYDTSSHGEGRQSQGPVNEAVSESRCNLNVAVSER
jgi:uncharacterized protein with HEPN domain